MEIQSVAVLIGLVKGISLAYPLTSGQAFLLSLAIGVIMGAFHYFGLSGVEAGVVASLSASGVYQVSKKLGGE